MNPQRERERERESLTRRSTSNARGQALQPINVRPAVRCRVDPRVVVCIIAAREISRWSSTSSTRVIFIFLLLQFFYIPPPFYTLCVHTRTRATAKREILTNSSVGGVSTSPGESTGPVFLVFILFYFVFLFFSPILFRFSSSCPPEISSKASNECGRVGRHRCRSGSSPSVEHI